jgi:hypothetical protein
MLAARRCATRALVSARPFSAAAGAASDKGEKLVIFDTTLRDGEQSPGATLTGDEKVEIGKQVCFPATRGSNASRALRSPPIHDFR